MTNIAELSRHFSRALETGRGLKLSGEELALLALTGAVELVFAAEAEFLEQQAAGLLKVDLHGDGPPKKFEEHLYRSRRAWGRGATEAPEDPKARLARLREKLSPSHR